MKNEYKVPLINAIMVVGYTVSGYGLASIPSVHGFILWAVGFAIGSISLWYSFPAERRFFIELWRWRFKEGRVPDEEDFIK